MSLKYIIFCSGGNDSIATIQHLHELGKKNVIVLHNDTGWSSPEWTKRIKDLSKWVGSIGFQWAETKSIGMRELVRQKQAFPRGGGGKYQWCTYELKTKPTLGYLDKTDPEKQLTCVVGIRREEGEGSRTSRRLTMPEWTDSSKEHGGRELWAPLVRHRKSDRDALIGKTPFTVLPHRSKECEPCVNMGKKELRHLPEERILAVEIIEQEAGINSRGNARVMFSPKRHNGAVGIREVVKDAKKNTDDIFNDYGCGSIYCHES